MPGEWWYLSKSVIGSKAWFTGNLCSKARGLTKGDISSTKLAESEYDSASSFISAYAVMVAEF